MFFTIVKFFFNSAHRELSHKIHIECICMYVCIKIVIFWGHINGVGGQEIWDEGSKVFQFKYRKIFQIYGFRNNKWTGITTLWNVGNIEKDNSKTCVVGTRNYDLKTLKTVHIHKFTNVNITTICTFFFLLTSGLRLLSNSSVYVQKRDRDAGDSEQRWSLDSVINNSN